MEKNWIFIDFFFEQIFFVLRFASSANGHGFCWNVRCCYTITNITIWIRTSLHAIFAIFELLCHLIGKNKSRYVNRNDEEMYKIKKSDNSKSLLEWWTWRKVLRNRIFGFSLSTWWKERTLIHSWKEWCSNFHSIDFG